MLKALSKYSWSDLKQNVQITLYCVVMEFLARIMKVLRSFLSYRQNFVENWPLFIAELTALSTLR